VSDINYLSINENFPVAGEDNDTQVFRDNFNTIKQSLNSAKTEITDLETNASRLDVSNDYSDNVQENMVLQGCKDAVFEQLEVLDEGVTSLSVSFTNGSYQILRFQNNTSLNFQELPASEVQAEKVGRIMLELYGAGSSVNINFVESGGIQYKKSSGFPDPLQVSSQTDPVFVEVWQHSSDKIFLRYLGQYS